MPVFVLWCWLQPPPHSGTPFSFKPSQPGSTINLTFFATMKDYRDCSWQHWKLQGKVVIWLPVPVKLSVTGFSFQLPVTDLPTFFLHVMQMSASASSHTRTGEQRQVYIGPRHTGAVDSSVPLVQVYPVFDCRVCSSPLPVSGRHSQERREGRGANWMAWHRLRPRVTARHFFWSNRCCMQGRAHWFNVDGDMSRFSWPSLALLGLHSSHRYQ